MVINKQQTTIQNAFFIKQHNLLRRISFDNILWIKTEGNYSIIHTTDQEFVLKQSLKKVLLQLPEEHFLQIQRAYIISIHKIEDIDIAANEIIIANKRLPLGRNYKEQLLSRLNIIK